MLKNEEKNRFLNRTSTVPFVRVKEPMFFAKKRRKKVGTYRGTNAKKIRKNVGTDLVANAKKIRKKAGTKRVANASQNGVKNCENHRPKRAQIGETEPVLAGGKNRPGAATTAALSVVRSKASALPRH